MVLLVNFKNWMAEMCASSPAVLIDNTLSNLGRQNTLRQPTQPSNRVLTSTIFFYVCVFRSTQCVLAKNGPKERQGHKILMKSLRSIV